MYHRAALRRRNFRHDLGLGGHFGGFRWAGLFEVDTAGKDGRQQSRRLDAKLDDPLMGQPPEIADGRPSLIDRNLTRRPAAAVRAGSGGPHGG